MRKIFLTGATGVMGSKGLKELTKEPEKYAVTVLARPSKRNRKKLASYIRRGVNVIWGDLTDPDAVMEGVRNADIVLHVGGMVSPQADWHPEQTIRVNISSIENIINAAKEMAEPPAVIYIGSVSQYGHRDIPDQWGQCGDDLIPAFYDAYAYSKTEAEKLLAESGLPKWVSLRQTGILHSGLLMKASDPIAFHVPLAGVLEWVTADDSGRLLERVCRPEVPEGFWNKFYNIGGGEHYRMTNYEFEMRLLKAMGCPPPEKVFEPCWFATRNFHGIWYNDSDILEEILHFRSGTTPEEYFLQMKRELPFYFSLAPLAPAFLIKGMMKRVAFTPKLGPMWWIKNNHHGRIKASFGSLEEWKAIPRWENLDIPNPDNRIARKDNISTPDYSISNILKIIENKNGKCLSDLTLFKDIVEPDISLDLECEQGHKFSLKARTLIEGGHWCGECLLRRVKGPEE